MKEDGMKEDVTKMVDAFWSTRKLPEKNISSPVHLSIF